MPARETDLARPAVICQGGPLDRRTYWLSEMQEHSKGYTPTDKTIRVGNLYKYLPKNQADLADRVCTIWRWA